MKNINIFSNLESCPSFDSCSKNLCPLDCELNLRYGSKRDKCRFMREPIKVKIAGREFTSGGAVMRSVLLKFVPQSNVEWLNEVSKQRWHEING